MGPFTAYYLFNLLLYILQIMHLIWFYWICKIAYKGFVKGAKIDDDRSEKDEEEEEKEQEISDDKKDYQNSKIKNN
jgi:hypothetical protein